MASLTDSDHARRPLEELLPPSFPLA